MPREGRSYRRKSRSRSRSRSRDRKRSKRSRSKERRRRSRSRDRRSRSRDRKRSRSKDRKERKRSRSRDRKRSRSRERRRKDKRSRSRDRSHRDRKSRSKSKGRDSSSPERKYGEGAIKVKDEPLDKEEEQKRLELEMQKRRERIEKWRAEKNKNKELIPVNIAPPSKKWSLEDEDDDDDDDDGNSNDKTDDDEVDPLDAYMQTVNEEVKSEGTVITSKADENTSVSTTTTTSGKVTIITAVAKKREDTSVQKGELMLNNVDLMEYSSEEEEEDLDTTMANMAKKKKELVQTDHSKVYYASFRKNFYVEVPEIAKMTPEEVEAYRNELEGIKVRGKGCPKPIKEWAQAGVSKKVLDCLKRNSFISPTPIQTQALPVIMSGRDLIGIAKTGSGKTLAFLLPMFRHILDQPELDEEDGPIAVIMTPTRELAMQITTECKKFTKSLGLHAVCVYGGTGISEQIAELKRGCEIIVCTPGRMIDMLAANNGKYYLKYGTLDVKIGHLTA